MRLVAALLLLGIGAGCTSPPSHLTRLWPGGRTGEPLLGLSTEFGIVLLTEPHYRVGDVFEVHFPFGNSVVRDWARIDRINDTLSIAVPITANVLEGRIATELPRPEEPVYLAMRDEDDEPVMEAVEPWRGGRHGDYVVVPGHDAEDVAEEYAGAGLYVLRRDRWQIVGILAGITARDDRDDAGLGYIGLLDMAMILPDPIDYFEHDIPALRPDFEFGVPLQPGDIELEPEDEPEPPS